MGAVMSIAKLRSELSVQEFFSVPEAAKLLRMDARTIRKMCAGGEIPGRMLRNRWRIPTWWLREQVGSPQRDGHAA